MVRRVNNPPKGDRKRQMMETLWNLQGGRCAICAGKVPHPSAVTGRLRAQNGVTRPNDPTIDHVVPSSRGGTNAITNLLLTHNKCNNERGDDELSPQAWRVWRSNLVGLDILAGKRPKPQCCGSCDAPHACEAESRCRAFHGPACKPLSSEPAHA